VASSQETRAQDLPADAKPLIGVDHWSGLLLAMYGVAHSLHSIDEHRQELRGVAHRRLVREPADFAPEWE